MTVEIDVLTPQTLTRPNCGINHVLAYGQSLSCGWDGWPLLTLTPRHDSLMLGESVHPRSHESPDWQPMGAPRFHPLVAIAQIPGTAELLQAGQPGPDKIVVGETILETALNEWRGRALSSGHATIGRNRLLASSCGVGGRSIEDLSPQASPNLFKRLRLCAEAARKAANAVGQSYGITAMLFLQGESNNLAIDGASNDPSYYTAIFRDLCQEFRALSATTASQPTVPVIFTYQTGGAYATASNPIPQAQLDIALEVPSIVLVSPVYYLPHTPSGHLDANGYRWLGAQFGKIMHRVLDCGEIFRPTHPIHAWCEGPRITIAFHVPSPPLAWGHPIPGNPSAAIPNRGFVVHDDLGEVPIISVELTGPETIRIELSRPPSGQAVLAYASAATGGRGCLHDSDSDQAATRYTIVPRGDSGFQTTAPEFEGKPYELRNWCAAFTKKVAASR
jgi:hypothetical protein